MRSSLLVILLLLAGLQARGEPRAMGPLRVGDGVEFRWAGGWKYGDVTAAYGLTYYVHWNDGLYDRFFHLSDLRPVDGFEPFDDIYHETTPDPEGGPVAIGETLETDAHFSGRIKVRVARRLGDHYVVFPEDEQPRMYGREVWVGLDRLYRGDSKTPLGATPPKADKPRSAAEIRDGSQVDYYQRSSGWSEGTVLFRTADRYYLQNGAANAQTGWANLTQMRPAGGSKRFQDEPLDTFIGNWRLSFDSIVTLGTESVKTNEDTVGQPAGEVRIDADGSYMFADTTIYNDRIRGKWVRNPDNGEGGVLLKDGSARGSDALITLYSPTQIYVQGPFRGPGQVGQRFIH